MTQAGLHLRDLSVGTLNKISLSVAPGEIVCLSGPSGSGKTRLLRAVADLEAHSGRVMLDNTDQTRVSGHCWRGWVMLVPAESQWWADTVAEHFLQPPPDGLEALGFDRSTLNWDVSRLSSGEKQRLALLRAVSHQPLALLLDEPTANLDGEATRRAEDLVKDLASTEHMPVLWVAHDPGQIARIAGRHFQIEGARLVEQAWN